MKKSLLGFVLLFLVVSTFAGSTQKVHKVAKGETLYSISRSYGLKVEDMVKANPELRHNTNVKLGQKLQVPVAQTATASVPVKIRPVPSTPDTPYSEEDNTSRVKAAQTDMAMATISDDPIVVDKPKIVTEVPVSLRTSSSNPSEYPTIFSQYTANGYKAKRSRGAANYLSDNTSGNQYLAFYNDAESGSVIKVTNMMNKRTVYVKVVGRVPYADASQEVILKLSNKAARDLGAVDEKFLVEVLGCSSN